LFAFGYLVYWIHENYRIGRKIKSPEYSRLLKMKCTTVIWL